MTKPTVDDTPIDTAKKVALTPEQHNEITAIIKQAVLFGRINTAIAERDKIFTEEVVNKIVEIINDED